VDRGVHRRLMPFVYKITADLIVTGMGGEGLLRAQVCGSFPVISCLYSILSLDTLCFSIMISLITLNR
ncbi:MAG: hypothetical protein ACREIQ_07415, partial [Nitrospiria bacterium]